MGNDLIETYEGRVSLEREEFKVSNTFGIMRDPDLSFTRSPSSIPIGNGQ